MSAYIVLALAMIFSINQTWGVYTTQNEYSVDITDGRCSLESKGRNELFNLNGEWYDQDQCMKYECRIEEGKAVVTQHRCRELVDEHCWIKKTSGIYPSCCYGATLCDNNRRRFSKRKSLKTNRFSFF